LAPWILLLVGSAAGCAQTEGLPDNGAPPASDEVDVCEFGEEPRGLIQIEEGYYTDWGATDPVWHAEVLAQLWSGPSPARYIEVVGGSCRVLLMDWGDCEASCSLDEFCSEDGECTPYPEGLSGGTLAIGGLGEPLSIEPESYNPGLYYGPEDLPLDLFAVGDEIQVALAGDGFPAVNLAARGVDPIDTELGDLGELVMPFLEDLEVQWTPGSDEDACVRLDVRAPTRGHGLTITAFLSCVGPDTGSFTIPSSLLAVFPDSVCPVQAGANCHLSELTRYTAQTAETAAGAVTLQVRSSAYFYYDHRP